jgi:hypothetical protein
MNHNAYRLAIASLIVAACLLAACERQDAAPQGRAAAPSPAAVPRKDNTVMAVSTSPAVSITGVELGNAPMRPQDLPKRQKTFTTGDTVVVTIKTATRDAQARVPGRLKVRWIDPAGKVFNEEAKPVTFNGAGVDDFRVAEPMGWKSGSYRVEVSLDGGPVVQEGFFVR